MAARIVTLRSPIEHEGKSLTEISLDLEKLTGDDALLAEREAQMENGGQIRGDPLLSKAYVLHVLSRASGVDAAVLKRLRIDDFDDLIRTAQVFFMGMG